jgi:cytochrome c biogenesis protein
VVDVPNQPTPTTGDRPTRARRRAAEGPFDLIVGSVWRFFASVRVAIWMIGFLTLLTLIGTLRGSVVPEHIGEAVPALQPLVDAWYGWNTFGSGLYAATMAMIAIGIIIGGMLNRIPGLWATIVRPTITTTRGFLRGTAPHATTQADTPVQALLADLTQTLKRRRYRVVTEQVGEDVHVYADRNRWGKLGTFPFHIALVMVVIGGILVTQFGFRDLQFVVAEGQTVAVGNDSDLSVRLNRFTDVYYADGTPAEYRSDVTVFDGDDELVSGSVQPNHPLEAGGVTLYQSGFGYNVSLLVTDRVGNELYTGAVTLGEYQASDNPDAPAGLLAVPGTNYTLNIIASDRDPENQPELDTMGLASQEIYIQARSPDFPGTVTPTAVITPNQPTNFGDLVVTFQRYGTYSVLQIAYYPALWLFGAAAVLGVGGLIAIFYFPHRRIRAIVSPVGANRSALLIAPLARRDWSGKRDFVLLLEAFRDATGTAVTIRDEPDRSAGPASIA